MSASTLSQRWCAAFAGVLAIGLALRLLGIGWGLPGEIAPNDPPIHPDEAVAWAGAVDLHTQPGAFTFIYGGALYMRSAHAARLAVQVLAPGDGLEVYRRTLLVLRVMGVLAGVSTAVLVAWIAWQLGGPIVALAAAALFLGFPNHVLASHYARPNVLMTLFSTAALACAFGVARGGGRRMLVAGAVAAGLATATLLSGLIGFLPLWVASFEHRPRGRVIRHVGVAALWIAGGGTLGYALGSLESLLYWDAFRAGLERAASTHQGSAALRLPVQLLTSAAFHGFGAPAAVAGYLGLGYFLWRREPGMLTLASYALSGVVLLARVGGEMMRHLLFLTPVVAVAASIGLSALVARVSRSPRQQRLSLGVAQAALVLFTLQLSAGYVLPMQLGEDPRHRTGRWLLANTPKGSRIGTTHSFLGDSSYSPRVPPGSGRRFVPLMLRHNFDASSYLDRGLDYVVTSDFARDHARGPTARGFFARLFEEDDYRLVAQIGPTWSPLSIAGRFGRRLPPDLLYVRPTFFIFERNQNP